MKKSLSFALLLGCLMPASVLSTILACPNPGREPREVPMDTARSKSKIILKPSKRNTVCVLIHLRSSDLSQTSVNVTSTSRFSDFKLTPVARSYLKEEWHNVAGTFETKVKVKKCNKARCVLRVPNIEPYSTHGKFFLVSYNNTRSFPDQLSRFFIQSTFGPSADMIDNWSYSEDDTGIAQYIKDQVQLPYSSHREEFRRNADFSLVNNKVGAAAVTPVHPCSQYSRWRDFAFSGDDYNKAVQVESFNGRVLISVAGQPRTIVNSFSKGLGAYQFGFRAGGAVGGTCFLKPTNGGYFGYGNPLVDLTSDAISRDPTIVVINLPERSNFEALRANWSPGLYQTPAGGSLRSTVDFMNDSNSNCNALSNSDYSKVLGKFPDGTYVWYWGYSDLDNNTPDSPIPLGGLEKKNNGLTYCSNVPKNFLNIETCTVSKEKACAGSPHYSWAPQAQLKNTVVCGSPNEVANDKNLPASKTNAYQFQGVADSNFFAGYYLQNAAVWYKTTTYAQDQIRQRAAWAFSEIFVVTQNQIDNGSIWSEMFLNYYDIFVRNAFGNFRDMLREVCYSPMMAEMLSFLDSASSLYALQREGRLSRPDENFAREIMQLFTVGLYELNMDGTKKMKNGEPVQTYDNSNIQTFAKAWTGFQRHGSRSNSEGFNWNPNKIDPMRLIGEKRDPFPKIDLNQGYIGDGYPLCSDLPSKHFLRKGAMYRAVGNWNQPELTPETPFWRTNGDTTRTVLDESSPLYKALCSANNSGECVYPVVVRLENDLSCTGVECNVDTLSMIKINDSPKLYYEYMPPPCIEMAFPKEVKKVVDDYNRVMCADPGVKDTVGDACCPSIPPATGYWTDRAWSYCEYTNEKMSFAKNLERCQSYGGEICEYHNVYRWGWDSKCGLGIQSWGASWRWANNTCGIQVKVVESGMISIVHNPNLDINTVLASKNVKLHEVHQPVSPDNRNYFKIKWDNNNFPAPDECGTAQQLDDGCLFDTEVIEKLVFNEIPTKKKLLRILKIGSPPPEWFEKGYQIISDIDDVKVYNQPEDNQNITERTIFGTTFRGDMKYYLNKESVVSISDGTNTFTFRNPPSLMSLVEQKTSDAYYETEALLDHYVYHSNTAPFIAKHMIKSFVTSNPSPGYVYRAATAFKTGLFNHTGIVFGDGVHGNLEALFAAILLDDEARRPVLDADPTFGSVRETIVKLIAFMRAMEFTQNDRVPTLRMNDMISKIAQEPYATPNVFSSFLPEYANPGDIKDANLVSPEAMILNAPSVVGFLNGLMSLVDTGLGNCFGGFGLRAVNNCNGYQSSYNPKDKSRGALHFVPKSTDAALVVDELALLLTAGRMSNESRDIVKLAYEQTSGASKKLRMAMKLMLMSPDFHTTGLFKSINEARPEPKQPDPPTNPYRALVYVNLDGGLDSFNALVPYSNCNNGKDMYKEYQRVRGSIAVTKGSLRQISASGQVCNTFGIHNKLPNVFNLYNQGDLSFFANTGVLQQPTTDKINYRRLNSKTALFAHNTQQEEVNSVDIYDEAAGIGIGGRIADMVSLNGYTSGTISVSGGAPALVSNESPLLVVNPAGYEKFNQVPWEQVSKSNIKELNKATNFGSGVMDEIWSDKLLQAMSENDILYTQMNSVSLSNTFPATILGKQMGSIAKLIKTRGARKTDRDVFYAKLSGFDTHGQQTTALDTILKQVDDALNIFVKEMKSQSLWNDVAVVFVSEFGRTLKANTGNGSDHAWGGNYFMASGNLKGGQIFGEYPDDLTDAGPQIVSDVGIVMPSTPWEALWNGVAQWFGVNSENDLKYVLPNRAPFENMLFTGNDLFN